MDHLFVHVSDIHVGRGERGEFMPEKLETCIDEVNELAPELVILTGDLTMFGLKEDYELAKKYVDKFKPKTLIIPGNHDARYTGYLYFEEFFGLGNWTHEMDDVIIVGIDSSIPDLDEGQVGRGRQDWVEENLQGVPDDVYKIIAVHHHLVSVPGTGRERSVLTDAGDFLQMLVRNRANLALCGHKHTPIVWRVEDLYVVTAGTPSSRKVRARIPQSYYVIEFKDIYTTINIKEVGGKEERVRKCKIF
ncbi:MAG: metallophosphoesterase [Candidatus Lokiarchaeia archaeon]